MFVRETSQNSKQIRQPFRQKLNPDDLEPRTSHNLVNEKRFSSMPGGLAKSRPSSGKATPNSNNPLLIQGLNTLSLTSLVQKPERIPTIPKAREIKPVFAKKVFKPAPELPKWNTSTKVEAKEEVGYNELMR